MKKKEIAKRTGCTKEQAAYLKEEFKKLPKVKDIFYNNIDAINLYGVDRLEVIRCYGYMDDLVNIRADRKTGTILGIDQYNMHLYHLSKNGVSYEVF